jgi:glycosyltransferase involved in cell wall biosynthesis
MTCKGRLSHAKKSLKILIQIPDIEIIFVDYSCPELSGEWVKKFYPTVNVIKVEGELYFNISKARNAGVKAAAYDWLCFIDADILLTKDFVYYIMGNIIPGSLYTFVESKELAGIAGTCVVHRDDLAIVGGYDEAYRGWGGEDADLYMCLELAGIKRQTLSSCLVSEVIRHSNLERTRHHQQKDLRISQTIATLYRSFKYALLSQTGKTPTLKVRNEIYDQCSEHVYAAIRELRPLVKVELQLPLSRAMVFRWVQSKHKICIELDLRPLFTDQSP